MPSSDDEFGGDDFGVDDVALESMMSMVESAHSATQRQRSPAKSPQPPQNNLRLPQNLAQPAPMARAGSGGAKPAGPIRTAGTFRSAAAPTTRAESDKGGQEPAAKRIRLSDPKSAAPALPNEQTGSGSAAPYTTTRPALRRLLPRKSVPPPRPNEDEVMPEISVREDGQYAIGGVALPPPAPVAPPQEARRQAGTVQPRQVSPVRLAPPQDQAIVRQKSGTSYRPGMPQLDDFEGDNDALWANTSALEQLEEEAISLSQQAPPKPNGAAHRSRDASPAPVSRPVNGKAETQGATATRSIIEINREAAFRRRIENLQKQVEAEKRRAQQAEEKAKGDSYKELGEAMILRQKAQKLESENAQLRKEIMEKEDAYKKQLEEERAQNAQAVQQMKTIDAFSRFERETSRWPGSTRKAPGEAESLRGPQTPTRRDRSTAATPRRPPGSRTRDEDDEDRAAGDSPSARQKRRNLGPQPLEQVKEFPGLDNAFASEAIETRKRTPAAKSARGTPARSPTKAPSQALSHRDDLNDELPPLQESPIQQQAVPIAAPAAQTAAEPASNYLWASSRLAAQHTSLVSFFLCHESFPHTKPDDVPLTVYHTQPEGLDLALNWHQAFRDHCSYPDSGTNDLRSTLGRIIATKLPPGMDQIVHDYHASALDALMDVLVQSPLELAAKLDDLRIRTEPLPPQEEQEEFWTLFNGMERVAGSDQMQALAIPILQLLGLTLRLCMMDVFCDILQLCTDACRVFPRLTECLVAESLRIPYMRSLPRPARFNAAGECIQPSMNTQGLPRNAHNPPRNMADILLEAVKKTWRLPLKQSSPGSYAGWRTDFPYEVVIMSDENEVGAHYRHPDAVAKRHQQAERLRQHQVREALHRAEQAWSMGEQVEEEVYEALLSMLSVLTTHLKTGAKSWSLDTIIRQDGLMTSFLHSARAPQNLIAALDLLYELGTVERVWEHVLGCRFDLQWQKGVRDTLTSSKIPLLDMLAKNLVDCRAEMNDDDAHAVHVRTVNVLHLFAQKYNDAYTVISKSPRLLAAVVSSLMADTTLLWNDRRLRDKDACDAVLTRISLDVALMEQLFGSEPRENGSVEPDLCACLAEAQRKQNGIRESFIVAFSHIAFAELPEWVDALSTDESERRMEGMAHTASSLLEVVVNPEELDEIWQQLAGEDEEGGAGDGQPDEEDEMKDARAALPAPGTKAVPPRDSDGDISMEPLAKAPRSRAASNKDVVDLTSD